jgi:hypothetical protein
MKKILIGLLCTSYLWSMSATDVMREVHKRADKHKTQKFDVSMVITDSNDRTRERFFTNSKQIKSSEKRGLIKFYKPTNIKNTALLTISKGGDKNQWIYLPAFKSIKKLNTEDKAKSFMGSDFSYSDIAGRNLEDDKHSMIKEDKKYYYVKSTPISGDDTYSKLELIVSKKLFVTLKVIFYDRDNNELKILSNKKFKKVKGTYFAVKSVMANKKTGGKTELIVDDIEVNLNIGKISIKSLR